MKDLRARQRTLARVAVVQALYRFHLTQEPIHSIIADFCAQPIQLAEDLNVKLKDKEFFSDLLTGITEDSDAIDEHLKTVMVKEWTLDRMEILLKDILRSAVYELMRSFEIPSKVIINEYVDITSLYYETTEPKMVNAMLDNLAHVLRSEEMGSKE